LASFWPLRLTGFSLSFGVVCANAPSLSKRL
jgi:hypothetical protein